MSKILGFDVTKEGYLTCFQDGTHWCPHIYELVTKGTDSNFFYPGMNLMIPVYPPRIFTAVSLAKTEEAPESAMIILHVVPDIGKSYDVRLGYWNPGDGLRAIRSVALDWCRSKLDIDETWSKATPIKTKCPSSTHGLNEERRMQTKAKESSEWKVGCLWHMVVERACTICVDDAGDMSDLAVKV